VNFDFEELLNMRHMYKIKWRLLLPLIICTCILLPFSAGFAWANDRSADIIGSRPLLVKNLLTAIGLSGQGQIVGIADSGLDKGSMTDIHPDLQSKAGTMPRVAFLKSFTDRGTADDPTGHGTFMAATIAGSGQASLGQYQGIAPGASLYFQALLDKNDNLKVPENIGDLFTPAYSAGVRIHVDGWGGGTNTYDSNSAGIDNFIYGHPDFLPVFGAGNNGPGNATLTAEANSKNALVIGSSQVPRPALDPESRYADQIAASSSHGPTGDGRIKPDLLAPGSALISACSSLVDSNFAANPLYTRMGGSSMAAAVTGGALALLREQLHIQRNITDPSSALLKALLINGARHLDGNPTEQGFGLLDSAGTALALKEGTFSLADEKIKLQEGQNAEYKLRVIDSSMPVKVTLAWVDPPAAVGATSALVNNLDLVARDPSGKEYYGNDFNHQGVADKVNNVEQVLINTPIPGEYTITVRAGQMGSAAGQDFALVYGQTLKTQLVQSTDGSQLRLLDGSKVNLDTMRVHQVVDGKLVDATAEVQVGSDIYLNSNTAYIFGQTWKTGGIQALPTAAGDLLLQINPQVEEGGYYLDPRALANADSIVVNGQTVGSISAIPTGSELTATLDPALQTLWKLEAGYRAIKGFIAGVNPDTRQVKLLGDANNYQLATWAAITYRDKIQDCNAQDRPYGFTEPSDIGKLLPGTSVTLQVSPQNQVVQSLLVDRPLVIGRVVASGGQGETITLDTGNSYQLFPGSSIYRDRALAARADIKAGDLIMAVMLPNSSTIIQVQAFSQVNYGRVVYANPQQKSLFLIDSNNRSQTYVLDKNTEVFGGGIPLQSNSIAAGSWVRVISDPTGTAAWRIDLAEIAEEKTQTVAVIDPDRKRLRMSDGSLYTYDNLTRITKGGCTIAMEDITPGDMLELTTLRTLVSTAPVLAGVEANLRWEQKAPELELTARALNGTLIIQGYTSGDRIYLYRNDGSYERIVPANGNISSLYPLLDNETTLRVAALDSRSGGMEIKDIEINNFPVQSSGPQTFSDISGHWAAKYINDLASRNIVHGFSDGTFRPDQPLSRAELMVMIAHLKHLTLTNGNAQVPFTDDQDIPWWALEAVWAAREQGIISGFPDGSFQPNQAVTRSEMKSIIAHINGGVANPFPDEAWQPDRVVTRAEAASILDNL
jgi:hypothetical protein